MGVMSPIGTKRTCRKVRDLVAIGGKADISQRSAERSLGWAGSPTAGQKPPVGALTGKSGLIVPLKDLGPFRGLVGSELSEFGGRGARRSSGR
jgi:hypothetical protein